MLIILGVIAVVMFGIAGAFLSIEAWRATTRTDLHTQVDQSETEQSN